MLKRIFNRTIFLYAAGALLVCAFADFSGFWKHVLICTLSRYMPAHEYLIEFNHDRNKYDFKKMREFELYYRKVTEFIPEPAEAYAMMGFCEYYGGQIERSRGHYEKAVKIYAHVFNFHYNLGVIALKRNHPDQAMAHFKNSVNVPPLRNIEILVTSQIYKPFIPKKVSSEVLASEMGAYVHDAYGRGYQNLLAIAHKQGDFETMLKYSLSGLKKGFLDRGLAYYYAGLASYHKKDLSKAVYYLQEAVRHDFKYFESFQLLALSLAATGRPESQAAQVAAASLAKDRVFFKPEPLASDLIIY